MSHYAIKLQSEIDQHVSLCDQANLEIDQNLSHVDRDKIINLLTSLTF